ncbi:MAG: ACP S-malonyltransferase [Burkholderiaceae bacterium]|jgi:[acyl-carrier-protein] S-malonyltransferase|nr:ACP S-malonyltransferase [Burkholderiaceae bacterium]
MKPVAFVFPGQGSQSVGMLDAWGDHPAVRTTLAEASEALHEDLATLIHAGPKEALGLTANTQPVMLAADIAVWRVWRAEGGEEIAGRPVALAGHSLGEYAALVAAEALPLAVAVPLVRLRAQAMQDAVPVGQGAMAAILGLDSDQVQAGCDQASQALGAGEVVEAVNFNDSVQTVIAGTKAGVEKACAVLKELGARRALPLPVSAPFHSSLMKPAAERLKVALMQAPLAVPVIPVVNNIDVAVESDPARIRDALYRQAFGPVRWVECVRKLKALGAQAVVECGPGKALTGMTKRIDPELSSAALYDPATLAEVKALLN